MPFEKLGGAVIAIGVAMTLATPLAVAQEAGPTPVDPAQQKAHDRVVRKVTGLAADFGKQRNERGLACITTPGSNATAIRKVRILVTSRSAVTFARRRAREAGLGPLAYVSQVSPRFERRAMARVSNALQELMAADLPEAERGLVVLGWESDDQPANCPRITLILLPSASEDTAAWAAEQSNRYGCDRVAVVRPAPGTTIPV